MGYWIGVLNLCGAFSLAAKMPTREEIAKAYFASLNPLAKKIIAEQENIISQYSSNWSNLSQQKKDAILDSKMIGTNLKDGQLKNASIASNDKSGKEYFPKPKLNPGEKIVCDHDDSSEKRSMNERNAWRDEHSAPFSWETRSQLDMSLDGDTLADRVNSPCHPTPPHGSVFSSRPSRQQPRHPSTGGGGSDSAATTPPPPRVPPRRPTVPPPPPRTRTPSVGGEAGGGPRLTKPPPSLPPPPAPLLDNVALGHQRALATELQKMVDKRRAVSDPIQTKGAQQARGERETSSPPHCPASTEVTASPSADPPGVDEVATNNNVKKSPKKKGSPKISLHVGMLLSPRRDSKKKKKKSKDPGEEVENSSPSADLLQSGGASADLPAMGLENAAAAHCAEEQSGSRPGPGNVDDEWKDFTIPSLHEDSLSSVKKTGFDFLDNW